MLRNPLTSSNKISQPTITIQTAKSFSVGQTIKAYVIASLSSDRFILNINGQNLHAKTSAPLSTGEIVHLKVISLFPKPTLEILGEHLQKASQRELFPPLITLNENSSSESIAQLFENANETIDGKLIAKSGNRVKIQVGNEILEGTLSNPNIESTKLRLKILSVYPRIILETLTDQSPVKFDPLSSFIDQYTNLKDSLNTGETRSTDSRLHQDVKDYVLTALSSVKADSKGSLTESKTWYKIIKNVAKEFSSPDETKPLDIQKLLQGSGDITTLVQDINSILANNNQFVCPIPIIEGDRIHFAEIVISKEKKGEHPERSNKDTYNAFICLETEVLGTLEVKVQLHFGKINVNIKGNALQVVKLISDNLDKLRELLETQGLKVGSVSTTYEKETPRFRELLIREVLKKNAGQMDIVV